MFASLESQKSIHVVLNKNNSELHRGGSQSIN